MRLLIIWKKIWSKSKFKNRSSAKCLTTVLFPKPVQSLGITLFILAGLTVTEAFSQDQTTVWSKPILLSTPGVNAWFPNVTADLTGGVHVFWSSGRAVPENKFGGYDTVNYCQPSPTGCAEVVEVVAREQSAGQINSRPGAVVDSQGTIHLLWHGEDVIDYASVPVWMATSAHSWSPWRRISGSQGAYYLNIAQDQRGVLHAAWSASVPQNQSKACSGCGDIFYRQSTDRGQTWSTPVDLSNTELGSEKPNIAFGHDGTVYVAWEEGHEFTTGRGQPTSSMIIASRDGSRTWEQPTTFSFAGDAPQSIAVGVDGKDKVVVVWQQVVGKGIFYQTSTDHGQSWSPPEQIHGVVTRSVYNDLDDYTMAPDSAGHLHLVLVGGDPQTPSDLTEPPNSVYHLEWDGTTWSKPDPIFTAIGDLPEWPRIAVGNGNQLHVVWFVRDKEHVWLSDGGKYQIWYAHGVSSAPPVAAPLAWPTSASAANSSDLPTPDLVVNATRPPTPVATLVPSLSEVSVPSDAVDSLYTDADESLLLVKSLIPVVLFVVAVVVGVRVLRRS